MRLSIHHRTEYFYGTSVRESVNDIRLYPRESPWQRCESSFLSILPATRLTSYTDLNHNHVHHFEIPEPHSRLVIDSRAIVETTCRIDFDHFPYGFELRGLGELHGMEECRPYLQSSRYVELNPDIWRRAVDIGGDSKDVFQTAYAIMEHIFSNYEYRSGATIVSTHANEVIEKECGVCQDFAHAMVAFCRALSIPARYVSGYFFDATRDNHLRGSEASHAWVEVYIKGEGWYGFDPTNNKVIDDTYVVLATGKDYRDVAPVVGTYYGGAHSALNVSVSVHRLDDPKLLRPSAAVDNGDDANDTADVDIVDIADAES